MQRQLATREVTAALAAEAKEAAELEAAKLQAALDESRREVGLELRAGGLRRVP